MDEPEVGLQSLCMRVLRATLEEIQPHRISLRLWVVFDSPKALMLSQYLCGTRRPDSSHAVHKVQIRDPHRELQRIRALSDCRATSICIAPQLLNILGLPHQAAHITTHGLDGQVIVHARECCKTVIMVHYSDHLAPVHEPEQLVIAMRGFNLALGLQWFTTGKLEIDRATARFTLFRAPSGYGEAPR